MQQIAPHEHPTVLDTLGFRTECHLLYVLFIWTVVFGVFTLNIFTFNIFFW